MSTKPEDAVYALLGLVPGLVPSLKRTFEATDSAQEENLFNLYLDVFQYCIEKEQDLAVLSAAGTYKGNKLVENWPAWLPDWRQKLPLRPLVLNQPTDLGPEAAFDDEPPGTPSPRLRQTQTPLYKMQFDPGMLPLSSRRFSMVVTGLRLGCIVTRPVSWPASFLVTDSRFQSFAKDDVHSQPLSSFEASFSALIQPSQTHGIPMVEVDYSAKLIRSSLKTGHRCCSIRTSAMVQTGDWLCMFRGGKVLYAVRPLKEISTSPPEDVAQGFRKRGRFGVRSPGCSTSSADSTSEGKAFKCIFIGECGVHGLNPAASLDQNTDHLQFELR